MHFIFKNFRDKVRLARTFLGLFDRYFVEDIPCCLFGFLRRPDNHLVVVLEGFEPGLDVGGGVPVTKLCAWEKPKGPIRTQCSPEPLASL